MNLLKKKPVPVPESTTMEVYFSGVSVEEHSMSVRDLAPALIGLSEAIDRYKELSCPFADLDVRITATKAGSFDVVLQILGTVVSLGNGVADVVGLASDIMDVLKIMLARHRQNGTVAPDEREVIEQSESNVELRIGNMSLNVSRKAYRAACDGEIINDLGEATKPAREKGYDPVRFIHKASGKDIAVPGPVSGSMSDLKLSEQPIEPSIETTTLQIDTIQFKSRKWKFAQGDALFWCEITDNDFLSRLDNGEESFSSGDLLTVRLETKQYIRNGRLETGERRITKVIAHTPLERQPTLGI